MCHDCKSITSKELARKIMPELLALQHRYSGRKVSRGDALKNQTFDGPNDVGSGSNILEKPLISVCLNDSKRLRLLLESGQGLQFDLRVL